MEITRTYKFPLVPRVRERRRLAQTAGACRWFRNQLIADNQSRLEAGEKYDPDRLEQLRLEYRREIDWVRQAPATAMQQVRRALNSDFAQAFKKTRGMPKFSAKGISTEYFRIDGYHYGINNNRIRLPNIGWVRMRMHLPLPEGKQGTVTVTRDGDRWFVCIPFTFEKEAPANHPGKSVGLDVGIAKTVAASDGVIYQLNEHFADDNRRRLEARRRRYQRRMARKLNCALRAAGWDGKTETRKAAMANLGKQCKAEKKPKRSRRYEIMRLRAAKASRKIRNCRHNALHHISKTIAVRHGVIFMENLKLQNMTKSAKGDAENPGKNVRAKAGLNREMLAAGLGGLRVMIAYKVEERGGKIEPVDPKNTSRTCPKCGMVAAENRRREAFKCVACGYEADADINAAVNILERGLSSSARGGGGVTRPVKRESSLQSVV